VAGLPVPRQRRRHFRQREQQLAGAFQGLLLLLGRKPRVTLQVLPGMGFGDVKLAAVMGLYLTIAKRFGAFDAL